MFVTVLTFLHGRMQLHQLEAPTVKDCLVAWAGRIAVEGTTDESRTRLRGDMADFDGVPADPFPNIWRFETDLGLGGPPEATVAVVETVRP